MFVFLTNETHHQNEKSSNKIKHDQTRSTMNYVNKQMEIPAQNFLGIAQSQN